MLFAGLNALLHGLDVRDVIALTLVTVVAAQLTQLIRLQGVTNERLDKVADMIDRHEHHQTARMGEIRAFMVSWWERFGPRT